MSLITTIRPDEATGSVREMYERQQNHYGYVPNYAKAFSQRPAVMGLWSDLLAGLRRHMDRRRFELVTLAAALSLRNTYCSLAHASALDGEFSSQELRAIASGADCAELSAAETTMMQFARKVAGDAASITATDVDELRAHGFRDVEIFDIVGVAAARAFFAKLLDGLGVQADSCHFEMDTGLRDALTRGRAIDTRTPERLGESRKTVTSRITDEGCALRI